MINTENNILDFTEDIITEHLEEIIELYGEDYTTLDVLEFASNDLYFKEELYKYWKNNNI